MSTKTTPAMQRAEAALIDHMDAFTDVEQDVMACECGEQIDRSGDNTREWAGHKVRVVLAAALDVEEIAKALQSLNGVVDWKTCTTQARSRYRSQARAVVARLLGGEA
jgi:hypothetical protein